MGKPRHHGDLDTSIREQLCCCQAFVMAHIIDDQCVCGIHRTWIMKQIIARCDMPETNALYGFARVGNLNAIESRLGTRRNDHMIGFKLVKVIGFHVGG